jgi:putative transposase
VRAAHPRVSGDGAALPPSPATNAYTQQRLPAASISHAVGRYCRFCLRSRDVDELLFARGVLVTDEAIRQWGRTCGQVSAHPRRRRGPRPGDTWHRDAVLRTSNAEGHSRWRAVDHDGHVLAMLVPRRRHQKAATQCCRQRLTGVTDVPRVLITDKRTSSGAATRAVRPRVEPRQPRYRTNRAENSPQPTRPRERRLQGFKAPGQAPRFLAAYGPLAPHLRPRRHQLPAPTDCQVMAQRFQIWTEVTGTAAASGGRSRWGDTPACPMSSSAHNKLTMPVQILLPKPGVERLNKRIIRGRPRPSEGKLDAMAMGASILGRGGELGAIIGTQDLRAPYGPGRVPKLCG